MNKSVLWRAFVALTVIAASFAAVSCDNEEDENFGDSNVKVICVTGDATDIDPTSAKVNGTVVISEANNSTGKAYFYYSSTLSDVDKLKEEGERVNAGSVSNSGSAFSSTLSNLKPGTKYYYVASVVFDGKDFFGSVKSFTTGAKPTELSVTGAASDITEYSARLTGYANLTPDMGEVTLGFMYSTNENPVLDNSVVLTSRELDLNNMYWAKATELFSNTIYYYKAFVMYGGVYRYGDVHNFKTDDFSVSTETLAASDITEVTAKLNGRLAIESQESLPKEVWFLYSNTASTFNDLLSSGTMAEATLSGSGFSANVTGLRYETKYYYVACSKVHDKWTYGEVKTFDTLPLSVTTKAATDISYLEATLNGYFPIELIEKEYLTNGEENPSGWNELALGFIIGTKPTLEGLKTSGELAWPEELSSNFNSHVESLVPGTTYYYVSFVYLFHFDDPYNKPQEEVIFKLYGNVMSFTTKQLEEVVDLGLSVKWRAWNVGASAPWEYGNYYAWGETNIKSCFDWDTYQWCNGDYKSLTKYNDNSYYGNVDEKTVLDAEDDVAHVRLGGNWRMPTAEEWIELFNKCTWKWSTLNGINGILVTASNGSNIFLPAAGYKNGQYSYDDAYAGYYWSSSLQRDCYGWDVYYDDGDRIFCKDGYQCFRSIGHSVRPVTE